MAYWDALLTGKTQTLLSLFEAAKRLAGKSDQQIQKWRNPRLRAIRNFIEACGDLPVTEIKRSNTQKFRESLSARVEKGLQRDSASKEIGYLSDLFRAWTEYHSLEFQNPFEKLRFKLKKRKTVGLTFSESWIRDKLLASGALDGLNEEARGVLLVMVNTGARPSEILGATFMVDTKVPYLDIAPLSGPFRCRNRSRFFRCFGCGQGLVSEAGRVQIGEWGCPREYFRKAVMTGPKRRCLPVALAAVLKRLSFG